MAQLFSTRRHGGRSLSVVDHAADSSPNRGNAALVREFTDNESSDWITVEDTSPNLTITKRGGKLSIYHPGGDSASELHGIVFPYSPAGSFYIESAVERLFPSDNYYIAGLVASTNATYGAGSQRFAGPTYNGSTFAIRDMTNWNNLSSETLGGWSWDDASWGGVYYERLAYNSSTGVWTTYHSPDGISWITINTRTSSLASISHVGYAVSTWGGSFDCVTTLHYFAAFDGTP